MNKEILLVTGIPRSGTSLISNILSKNPRAISFSEPRFIKNIKAAAHVADDVTFHLEQSIKNIRENIKVGRSVEFRVHKNPNQNLDNYFTRRQEAGKEVVIKNSSYRRITLPKTRHSDLIVIKNNLLLTACIQSLIKRFQMLVVVRDPVATLSSWNSLDIPVSRGKVKSGFKYCQTLQKMVNSNDLLERQIQIFDWFCYQYRQLEKQVTLVKYEELVKYPNNQLSKYLDYDTKITGLKNMNDSAYYPSGLKNKIIDKIGQLKPENLLHYYPI